MGENGEGNWEERKVPVESISESDRRFCEPVKRELVALVARWFRGEIASRVILVAPTELVPNDPATLNRARAALLEEPGLRRSIEELLRSGDPNGPCMLAFRDPRRRLRIFDDYAMLAVALEAGITPLRVRVLGQPE